MMIPASLIIQEVALKAVQTLVIMFLLEVNSCFGTKDNICALYRTDDYKNYPVDLELKIAPDNSGTKYYDCPEKPSPVVLEMAGLKGITKDGQLLELTYIEGNGSTKERLVISPANSIQMRTNEFLMYVYTNNDDANFPEKIFIVTAEDPLNYFTLGLPDYSFVEGKTLKVKMGKNFNGLRKHLSVRFYKMVPPEQNEYNLLPIKPAATTKQPTTMRKAESMPIMKVKEYKTWNSLSSSPDGGKTSDTLKLRECGCFGDNIWDGVTIVYETDADAKRDTLFDKVRTLVHLPTKESVSWKLRGELAPQAGKFYFLKYSTSPKTYFINLPTEYDFSTLFQKDVNKWQRSLPSSLKAYERILQVYENGNTQPGQYLTSYIIKRYCHSNIPGTPKYTPVDSGLNLKPKDFDGKTIYLEYTGKYSKMMCFEDEDERTLFIESFVYDCNIYKLNFVGKYGESVEQVPQDTLKRIPNISKLQFTHTLKSANDLMKNVLYPVGTKEEKTYTIFGFSNNKVYMGYVEWNGTCYVIVEPKKFAIPKGGYFAHKFPKPGEFLGSQYVAKVERGKAVWTPTSADRLSLTPDFEVRLSSSANIPANDDTGVEKLMRKKDSFILYYQN